MLKRHILPKVNTDFFDLDFSYCELTHSGEIRDSQGLVLGNFYISDNQGDWTLKSKEDRCNSKADKNKISIKDEKPDNLHKVRKKIEEILLERENKKLWEL